MNFLLRKIAEETWNKFWKEMLAMTLASALGSAGQSLGSHVIDKIFNDDDKQRESVKDEVTKRVTEDLGEHIKRVLAEREQAEAKSLSDEKEMVDFIKEVVREYIEENGVPEDESEGE